MVGNALDALVYCDHQLEATSHADLRGGCVNVGQEIEMAVLAFENNNTVGFNKTSKLASVLLKLNIYLGLNGTLSDVHRNVIEIRKDALISQYTFWENPFILHTMGTGSYNMADAHRFSVGAYCSLAKVYVLGERHALEHVTTSSINHDIQKPHFRALAEDYNLTNVHHHSQVPANKGDPIVGNDVWLAHDVTLNQGISLGDGCVVAAGSIVVKDVEPFMIVGGNPAKAIRSRFDQKTVQRLSDSQWWSLSPEVLDFNIQDPNIFLDKIERKADLLGFKKKRTYATTWRDIFTATEAETSGLD